VQHLRHVIRAFRPDVVFVVERPAAIVAARLENVTVFTTFGLPMGKSFAANPEYSKGVNGFLRAHHLPQVESVLDLYDWADRKVVPSSPDLEPLADDNVVYLGSFRSADKPTAAVPYPQRKLVVAYTGLGGVSPARLIRALSEAFPGTEREIYLATREVKPFTSGALHVDGWFDFDELLPQALVYIHHGGQNSVTSGLIHGVPQIICPGKHYERQYNASSVERIRAGFSLDTKALTREKLRELVGELKGSLSYAQHASDAGRKLVDLGGLPRLLDILQGEVAARGGG
jgi:UDP:flavonoid glycosyltransferase YjiC (YdhE family)